MAERTYFVLDNNASLRRPKPLVLRSIPVRKCCRNQYVKHRVGVKVAGDRHCKEVGVHTWAGCSPTCLCLWLGNFTLLVTFTKNAKHRK